MAIRISTITIQIESEVKSQAVYAEGEFQDATEYVQDRVHEAIAKYFQELVEDDENRLEDMVIDELADDGIKIDKMGDLGDITLRFRHEQVKTTHGAPRKYTGKAKATITVE